MEPGLEFRRAADLESLFNHHQHWLAMKPILTKGVSYVLDEISKETRKEDLAYMMRRGNHQSASDPDNAPTLAKNYKK